MDSELWFSRRDERLWAAVVEDRRIVEIHPARPSAAALIGAVYLARVQRVVPHLGAAFVQLEPGIEGYLEASGDEVRRLGSGQALVVQVRREAHADKRARVSTRVEFAGSRMSLRPGEAGVAVSRRVSDPSERQRLEAWARDRGPGRLVLRTAAAGASEDPLNAELGVLLERSTSAFRRTSPRRSLRRQARPCRERRSCRARNRRNGEKVDGEKGRCEESAREENSGEEKGEQREGRLARFRRRRRWRRHALSPG